MDRNVLVAVALGEQPAELVVTGGQLVNVWSGEIYPADIAVAGNRIAVVGDAAYTIGPDTTVVDVQGQYLVPGLIECHFHFGASSLPMTEFARLVVPFGTAAIVTDFTEAGKMQGVPAMRFFLDEIARTPLKAYFSPFYTTMLPNEGRQSVTLEEMEEILDWPECLELREWNVQGERSTNEAVRRLGETARRKGRKLSGHLRAQKGRVLDASVASGTYSDHEAKTVEEVIDRVRAGVAMQMRYGSAHHYELQEMLKAVTQHRIDSRLLMFSTDEEDIDDIADLGFIDHRVRMAIRMGVPPIDAVRMGSLNAATALGVTGDLGSLAPGRIAFINVVDNLGDFRITQVVYGAEVVAKDGVYVGELERPEYPEAFYDTIRIAPSLSAEDFDVAAPDGHDEVRVRVMGVSKTSTGSEELLLTMAARDGKIPADPDQDIARLAVLERHAGTGKIGKGFAQGLGMKRGALGVSYHPGPCNVGVVGMNGHDMSIVANRIRELGGGFVAALDGKIIAEAPLPILGLVSDRPYEEVLAQFREVKAAIRDQLGIDIRGMFMMLAILFIPGVAPRLRLSVNGPVRIELREQEVAAIPVPLLVESDNES